MCRNLYSCLILLLKTVPTGNNFGMICFHRTVPVYAADVPIAQLAQALQEYRRVVVDVAGGCPICAGGPCGRTEKSWEGILGDWNGGVPDLPLVHYWVLSLPAIVKMGDARWKSQVTIQVN